MWLLIYLPAGVYLLTVSVSPTRLKWRRSLTDASFLC